VGVDDRDRGPEALFVEGGPDVVHDDLGVGMAEDDPVLHDGSLR
jgi:hypothetical protein